MAWIALDGDRWTNNSDDVTHLLRRIGIRYVELHHDTVHVYDGPDVVADPEQPLAAATWKFSDEQPGYVGAPEEDLWVYLKSPAYTR